MVSVLTEDLSIVGVCPFMHVGIYPFMHSGTYGPHVLSTALGTKYTTINSEPNVIYSSQVSLEIFN